MCTAKKHGVSNIFKPIVEAAQDGKPKSIVIWWHIVQGGYKVNGTVFHPKLERINFSYNNFYMDIQACFSAISSFYKKCFQNIQVLFRPTSDIYKAKIIIEAYELESGTAAYAGHSNTYSVIKYPSAGGGTVTLKDVFSIKVNLRTRFKSSYQKYKPYTYSFDFPFVFCHEFFHHILSHGSCAQWDLMHAVVGYDDELFSPPLNGDIYNDLYVRDGIINGYLDPHLQYFGGGIENLDVCQRQLLPKNISSLRKDKKKNKAKYG